MFERTGGFSPELPTHVAIEGINEPSSLVKTRLDIRRRTFAYANELGRLCRKEGAISQVRSDFLGSFLVEGSNNKNISSAFWAYRNDIISSDGVEGIQAAIYRRWRAASAAIYLASCTGTNDEKYEGELRLQIRRVLYDGVAETDEQERQQARGRLPEGVGETGIGTNNKPSIDYGWLNTFSLSIANQATRETSLLISQLDGYVNHPPLTIPLRS